MRDPAKVPSRSPTTTPSRTPSRTPTRSGRGAGRKGPERYPLPPGTVLKGGAFRIVSVIGEGGFSITYEGLEGTRQLRVAIKELFPLGCFRHGYQVLPSNHWDGKSFATALDDFVSEGKVLKLFTHPGIVQSYAPFEENGTAYLAMEYLQGESLLLGLQRRGAMNQAQALEITHHIGGALSLVHASNVIHSDIKPENIIYTEDHRFVLLDFGISRRSGPGRAARSAVLSVSPGYSPPEQYHASKPLTPATDVYGLAATIYTMLSFSMPADAVLRERGEPLPSLLQLNPTVSPRFWGALERALDLNPERRQQSMAEFVLQLGGKDIDSVHAQTELREVSQSALTVHKVAEFRAHRGGICGLLLHPHRPWLISGARGGTVKVWTWPSGKPQGALHAHDTAVSSLALSPSGQLLATAGEPGEVKLWQMESGQMLRLLHSGPPAVARIAFSTDNEIVAVAMADGTVRLFTAQQAAPIILSGHNGPVHTLAFSPNGALLASAGHDGAINLWSTATATLIGQLLGHHREVRHVAFSPDSKLLLGSSHDTTRVWEIEAALEMRRYREEGGIIWSGAFSSDPDVFVTASGDRKARFYRLSTGRRVAAVEADNQYVRSVACDPRLPIVATGGGDGHIRIWQF